MRRSLTTLITLAVIGLCCFQRLPTSAPTRFRTRGHLTCGWP